MKTTGHATRYKHRWKQSSWKCVITSNVCEFGKVDFGRTFKSCSRHHWRRNPTVADNKLFPYIFIFPIKYLNAVGLISTLCLVRASMIRILQWPRRSGLKYGYKMKQQCCVETIVHQLPFRTRENKADADDVYLFNIQKLQSVFQNRFACNIETHE